MTKLPVGTFINAGAVIVGSLVGLMLQQVVPDSMQYTLNQAVGLGLVIVGIQMALKVPEGYVVLFIFSLIFGGIAGELIGLKEGLDNIELWFESDLKIGKPGFSKGLILGLVLFCASPITIVGALEEGLRNKRELLVIKSAFDGVMAAVFASAYGFGGVVAAVIPLLIIQGGLTGLAKLVETWFNKATISLISGVGGVLLLGLSIRLMLDESFFIADLLPALPICVLLLWGSRRLGWKL